MTERKEDESKLSEEEIEQIKKEKEEEEEINLMMNKLKINSPTVENEEESESSTKPFVTFPDENQPELDSLDIAMGMIIEYHDFIGYMLDVFNEDRGDAEIELQKWTRILNRAKLMIEFMFPELAKLKREMEKLDENPQFDYVLRKKNVEFLMKALRHINARIEQSPDFKLLSNPKFTDLVMTHCKKLLRTAKEEMSELIQAYMESKAENN